MNTVKRAVNRRFRSINFVALKTVILSLWSFSSTSFLIVKPLFVWKYPIDWNVCPKSCLMADRVLCPRVWLPEVSGIGEYLLTEKSIEKLPSIFFPSEGNVDKLFFYPIAVQSRTLDCMVGYFSSGVLAELALTISSYLSLNTTEPMRFIVSPNIKETDLQAIREAYSGNVDFFNVLFPNFNISEKSLRTYTVAALAFLVASKKIEIRVALKKKGLFHTKAW